jgi:hypothetical protein
MKEENFLEELHEAVITGDSDSNAVRKIIAIDELANKKLGKIAKSKKKLMDGDYLISITRPDMNKLKNKKVKRVSLIKKIKSWYKNLPSKFAKKYVGNMHPKFLELIEHSVFSNKNYYQEIRDKKAKAILELISSPRYKKFFYSIVGYRINQPAVKVPITWFEKLIDKIAYNLSKLYVRIFAKNLYLNIKLFEETSKNIISFNKKIDEYMANTTLDERIDRATEFGIISNDRRTAHRRLYNMQAIGAAKIRKRNQL